MKQLYLSIGLMSTAHAQNADSQPSLFTKGENFPVLSHNIPAGDADLISSIVRNASSGRNVYNELRKAFKKDWKRYYDVVRQVATVPVAEPATEE